MTVVRKDCTSAYCQFGRLRHKESGRARVFWVEASGLPNSEPSESRLIAAAMVLAKGVSARPLWPDAPSLSIPIRPVRRVAAGVDSGVSSGGFNRASPNGRPFDSQRRGGRRMRRIRLVLLLVSGLLVATAGARRAWDGLRYRREWEAVRRDLGAGGISRRGRDWPDSRRAGRMTARSATTSATASRGWAMSGRRSRPGRGSTMPRLGSAWRPSAWPDGPCELIGSPRPRY